MAKTPKTQDPTQAALSAIEDALKLGEDAFEPAPGTPAANDPSKVAPPSPSQRQGRRLERANRASANDDRQAVGQILTALHSKPSMLPFLIGGGLAAWWVLMTLVIGYARSRADIAAGVGIMDLPGFWTFFMLLVLPPAAFILMASFVRRTQEMRMVARAMTEVTVRLAEPEGVSTDAIVSVGQAIRREVAALGDGIERAIARATELETMVREEVSTLERAYDENEMRIRTLVEELQSDGIVSHGTRLRDAVSSAHERFNLDVKNVTDSVNAVVDQAVVRITDHILAQSETARSQVEEAGNVVLESFTAKSNDMTDRLMQIGVEVANAITTRTTKVTDELNTLTTSVTDKVDESIEEMAGAIAAKGDAVRDVLSARLRQAEDSLAQRGNEIADRIGADSGALARRITDGLQGFDTTVRVYGTGLLEQITQTVDYVNEHTRTTLTNFDEKVGAKIRETHEGIDSRINRIEETIDTRAKTLNEALAARTLELANTLNEGGKITTEAVEKSLAGADEYFGNKAQEIARALTEKTDHIDQTLGSRATALTESLDGRIRVFETQVTERLEGITNSIEKRGIAAADHLAAKVASVTGDLGAKIEAVSGLLRSDADEVEKSLVAMADQVSKTLIERTREVTSSHETLKKDVTNVLSQLGEANGLLKDTLDGLTGNLTPLASTVTERISSFQAALENTLLSSRSSIEHMDGQMRDLRDISTGVVRDIGILTQRFEDQGRFIAGAADTLQETHRRIDTTLSDRRDAIERFTSLLGNRASDMEERLIRFNRLLQDSLGAAEERAHEIAKLVADSTAQSTNAISQQYDVLRAHSDEERERTAAGLKQSYDKTMDEVRAIFGDANQRFAHAAQELREVASEVQSALETTRQEIKRGVLELPHETQESTNAMRRVVADQIKALAELNEIVSRHARGIDVVEPRQLAAPGAGAGPRIVSTREAVAEYAAPAQSRGSMPRATHVRAVEQEPMEQVPGPRRSGGGNAAGGARQSGAWLNELLTRAPGKEDAGEPDAAGSLDSLSVDIARMIDHDSAVEFWSRYKRGERNVVTRRLYTPHGQKTFEDIRKRYRKSAEFRDTVDRYIDEFERLLEQVSRDDRGQALSKTYLTSDTGKVYTLLSHAAGRLG